MHRRAFTFSSAGLALASLSPVRVLAAQAQPMPTLLPMTAEAFNVWRESYIAKAIASGLPETLVRTEMASTAYDPDVIRQDRHQSEAGTAEHYMIYPTSPGNIHTGQAKLAQNNAVVSRLQSTSGVPGEIIVAVWGMESGFGANTGHNDVLTSLATLAADGRRGDANEAELNAALHILASREATRAQMRGSWAGAMGQTQFEPTAFLLYAVDGDGDGRRDIWGSSADALASTANYLVKKGEWRRGESWAREVIVPRASGFDYSQIDQRPGRPQSEWLRQGIRFADSEPARAADASSPAVLLMPMGWQGPGFLAWPNHYAIRAYNNSTNYGLAVGLMADLIAGRSGLVQPWPADAALTRAEATAAQQALLKLGFDPGKQDGMVGGGTRKAAQQWQKARGLPADGYLNAALVQRLTSEAGVGAATGGQGG